MKAKGDSARDTFFYYTGPVPSAVRYKNWKLYYAMAGADATGGLLGPQTFKWTQITNIKRDPFEIAVVDNKSALALGGALAAPSTAYIYDWNILPIGQRLWLKELESYKTYPPMQDPASYNLDQVLQQVKDQKHGSPAGE